MQCVEFRLKMGTGSRLISLEAIDKISVAGASIQPAACLKSLGVLVDSKLSMDKHVNYICRLGNYHIHALRQVRSVTSLWVRVYIMVIRNIKDTFCKTTPRELNFTRSDKYA